MAKQTQLASAIAMGARRALAQSRKGSEAALRKGYPKESKLTKRYYAGIGELGKYGDKEVSQALDRSGTLYGKYGEAGKYDKTKFADIGKAYEKAGEYDPSKFTKANYTKQNIKERMSPYEKLVSEQANARLKKNYDEARGERELQAARAGAFGGSGAAVQEEAARRNYLEQSAQMNAQNLQNAYDAAVNLYGREVADRLSSEQLKEASKQFGKNTELAGLQGVMAARQQTAAQEAAAKEAEFAGLQGQAAANAQQAELGRQEKAMKAANLTALQSAGQQQQQNQLANNQYALDIAQRQANVVAGVKGASSPLAAYASEGPSNLDKILAAASAGAGVLKGLTGLAGGGLVGPFYYSNGGFVYRGGGLADLEPEYYDAYER